MSTTWRQDPFKEKARYRVKTSFSSLDDFTEGEVLTYKGSAYSPYDSMSGFDFTDQNGKNRRWDLPNEEPIEVWNERFEEIK